MKRCKKCGCIIINGDNGCMLMDICFNCNGGFPKYAPSKQQPEIVGDYEEAILERQEEE